jgi:hypothetical protein
VPENVALIGNRVVTDVITYGEVFLEWGRLLIQYDWCSNKKRRAREVQTHRGECHMKIKSQMEELQFQAKKCQESLAEHQKLGRDKQGVSPPGFRGILVLPTP